MVARELFFRGRRGLNVRKFVFFIPCDDMPRTKNLLKLHDKLWNKIDILLYFPKKIKNLEKVANAKAF